MVGRFHFLMLYSLPQPHSAASIYHVEVEEGEKEEEGVGAANGARGPERGQDEGDVVE